MDDPLSGLLSEGSKPAPNAPTSVHRGESVFRTVDASKLQGRPIAANPKPVTKPDQLPMDKVEQVTAQKTVGSAKGLGFGVDLWAESGTATGKSKTSTLDDLLSVSSSETLDAGIFKSGGGATAATTVRKNVDEQSTGRVRVGVAVASDESQLNDLKMASRLLEREEELDYETFGKTTHAQILREKVVKSVQAGTVRGDLELESEDVLARMEGDLANRTESALYKPSVSSAAAVPSAPKPVEVDLANLDLDSYIQSQGQSGGGLFD